MNEFGHLPVEGVGVGIGSERGSRKRGQRGVFGGCRPGIACNKFNSVLKGGRDQFIKTCTSFNRVRWAVIESSSGISKGEMI